ncbi:7TM GPCR protein, partial [Aphelenchoides avenae]
LRAVHHGVDATVSGTSLFLNVGLLYLILTKSVFKVKAFKRIFLMTCICDICLGCSVFFGSPAIFMSDGYMILVANGFFANHWELLDRVCLAVYCATLHTNIVCVTVQFVYRYQILCCQHEPKKRGYMLVVWPLVWCSIQMATAFWCFVAPDTPVARKEALDFFDKIGFHYDNGTTPFPSVSHLTELRTQMHHTMYMISTVGGYSIVVWCQYKIFAYLKSHGKSMHERTRRAHAEVNRALIILAITPLISSIGPTAVIVLMLILQLQPGPYAVAITLCMSMITLVNPVTIVYFVRPFRRAISDVVSSYSRAAAASTMSVSKIDLSKHADLEPPTKMHFSKVYDMA